MSELIKPIKKSQETLSDRENNFSLGGINQQPLRPYNALSDPYLRQHFGNKAIRSHLRHTGVYSPEGRTRNPLLQKSAFAKSESERKRFEKNERIRQQEEDALRRRVYIDRVEEIENERQRKRVHQLKTDKLIAREIVRATRGHAH
ncbi:unnamed protein product [Albugo candida]|uniref:Uncharacterized protein n=1 Tax=Albugo candida TaxID=65357 RepID=A0A024GQS2_9STRA|nr:unnamed protein product [Albugo candida]|eukprot:CCI48708.1 unnamed protein product [Albugo candida]